jgi:hypothetical protein
MENETYCFLYDRRQAAQVFKRIDDRKLVLAILAINPPDPGWDGCVVFRGDAGQGEDLVCIATRGPAARAAQERLIEGFERHGIVVQQVFEGGPEQEEQTYAHAAGGVWQEGADGTS